MGNKKYAFAAFLLFAVSLLPLFAARFPPLVDLPLHASRVHLISSFQADPFIQEHYTYFFHLSPYLAVEMITLPLLQWLSLETAISLFIVLSFFLLFSGTIVLHRLLFGFWSYWPLVSSALLYSYLFEWGFLPYLFGVGAIVWAMIGWITFSERPLSIRVPYGILCGLLLYFFHLAALGLFGVCLFLYEVTKPRSLVALISPFVIPMILFLFFSPIRRFLFEGSEGTIIEYDWGHKIKNLLFLFSTGNVWIDRITLIAISVSLFLIYKYGKVSYSKQFVWVPLGLLGLYFVVPFTIGHNGFLDFRIPILIGLFLIAATNVTSQRKIVYGFIFSCIIIRFAFIGWDWVQFDKTLAQYIESFEKLSPESTLFVASQKLKKESKKFKFYNHIGSYAAIVNQVFVPGIHVQKNVKLISVKDKYDPIEAFQAGNPTIIKTQKEFEEMIETIQRLQIQIDPSRNTYLLVNHERPFAFNLPEAVTLVHSGEGHQIFLVYDSTE